MTTLLRYGEIENLLDLRQAIKVLEEAYKDQSQGGADQVPPFRLMNRGMRLAVGGLPLRDRRGIRLSVTGGEAVALVFEISSGKLLSVMGYPFSKLRIGATVAIALERLAPPRAGAVAMIGSGRNALWLLQAATAVRPIRRVFVYSRSAERRESFAHRAAGRLGVPAVAVSSPQEAIENSEVVLVSTNSPTPALLGEWLRPGLSIFGAGRPNEFDDGVYLMANLIAVVSKAHELAYYDTKLDQPLIRLSQEGSIPWENVAELGDILCGKVSLPDGPRGLIVFRDSQGGYGDVALAAWAYEEARRKGLGCQISIE